MHLSAGQLKVDQLLFLQPLRNTNFTYCVERKVSVNNEGVCKHHYSFLVLGADVFCLSWHFTTLPTSAPINTGVHGKIYKR